MALGPTPGSTLPTRIRAQRHRRGFPRSMSLGARCGSSGGGRQSSFEIDSREIPPTGRRAGGHRRHEAGAGLGERRLGTRGGPPTTRRAAWGRSPSSSTRLSSNGPTSSRRTFRYRTARPARVRRQVRGYPVAQQPRRSSWATASAPTASSTGRSCPVGRGLDRIYTRGAGKLVIPTAKTPACASPCSGWPDGRVDFNRLLILRTACNSPCRRAVSPRRRASSATRSRTRRCRLHPRPGGRLPCRQRGRPEPAPGWAKYRDQVP